MKLKYENNILLRRNYKLTVHVLCMQNKTTKVVKPNWKFWTHKKDLTKKKS